MDVLPAHQQVDAGDGQHDGEQNDGCRRCKGRIAAGVTVQHVVDIAHHGVHLGGVQVGAEQGHRVAVRLECADEAGDDQIEDHGGDHGQGDAGEDAPAGRAVHAGGVVVVLLHRGQRTGEDQDLEGQHYPHGVEAQDEHLSPVRPIDKIHAGAAEPVEHHIYQPIGVGGLFEQNHENQTHRQRIGDVGQEIHRLEQAPQLFDGAEPQRDEEGKAGGHRHGDDDQDEGVFQCLQKVGVPQHVAVVEQAHTGKCLGRGIVPLLKGVHEHVHQRVDHEHAQKGDGGQQIEPALDVALVHGVTSECSPAGPACRGGTGTPCGASGRSVSTPGWYLRGCRR